MKEHSSTTQRIYIYTYTYTYIYIHATNLVERPRASADVHQIQRRWRLNRHVRERSPPDVVVRGEREPSGHVHRAQRGGMDGRYDERFEKRSRLGAQIRVANCGTWKLGCVSIRFSSTNRCERCRSPSGTIRW